MSDLYHASTPFAQAQFRSTTDAGAMPGAGLVPKKRLCTCCEKMRTEKTGIHTADGFVCGMCHSPRRVV